MNGISARLAAASGAYFVVAAILGSLGPTRSRVGLLVILTGLVALLVFLGFLQRLLVRTSTAPAGRPGLTATGCGLLFLAMQASELAYFGVDYQSATSAPDARLLEQLIEATFVSSTIFFGLFVVSAALETRHQRVLPGWLTWPGVAVGAAAAVVGAVGTLAVGSPTSLPYVAALAWTAVVSLVLALRPAAAAAESVPAGPATRRADVAGAV
jgi:hypothetical protein